MNSESKAITLGLLLLLFASLGCTTAVTQIYGDSDGFAAKSSPGGMTVFRSMVEQRGFSTFTVRSLSPANMKRLNTIVWTPNSFPVHNKETYDWLETWMNQGGKTLVYIGRDFSPHAAYWSEIADKVTANGAPVAESLKAREQAAFEQSIVDRMRRSNRPLIIMPWCKWKIQSEPGTPVEEFSGPWGKQIDPSDTAIVMRTALHPLRSKEINDIKKQMDWESDQPTAATNTDPYEKQWLFGDSNLRDVANRLQIERLSQWTNMLTDLDNQPIIGIASDDALQLNHVILVANNSLFCNLSMLRQTHRQLASKVIDKFAMGGVGFVSGERDPVIRTDNMEEQQRGFEMLTAWPLNVVTIHAAFLGLAAMIAAFPIFGRPKRLRQRSTSDFGQHIDAVGELMQRSGDKEYATKQIADYFRVVRNDPASPWAALDPAPSATDSPFKPAER